MVKLSHPKDERRQIKASHSPSLPISISQQTVFLHILLEIFCIYTDIYISY